MEAATSTAATLPAISQAIEGGQWGLAIGGILLLIVGVLRRTHLTKILDSSAGVIATAVISFVAILASALVATGGDFLAALGPALSTGLPVLFGAFVRPVE